MKKNVLVLMSFLWMVSFLAQSQTTNVVILNAKEAGRLRKVIQEYEQAKQHYDSIVRLANQHLKDKPRPLKQIFYEGLLDTNPDRIDTQKSLEDIDKTVNLIYAFYGRRQILYAGKAKEIITAWVTTY